MATRCLYCGGSSWRPLRWLRDQEFCSREHRELYRARLQRVVGALATYPAVSPESAPGVDDTARQGSAPQMDRPAVAAEVLPLGVELPAAAATQEKLAPAIVVSDTAVAQELTEMLHLESEAPTTVWIPPDALPPDLRPREGHTALPISPTIGPISAANAGYPVPHLAGALPASFETHVQIKRWGLKIRFQKA